MTKPLTIPEIVRNRLINQQIAFTRFKKPEQIVSWLGAMQSQVYAFAKWAIGLRLPGSNEAMVEQAFNEGRILRTHMLRPTWHFVTPTDIRWMLALTAPRVNAFNAYMYRKLGLENRILNRSTDILIEVLRGGKHLNRLVLRYALAKAKIRTDENRMSHLLMHAELAGIICSGPRQGKQFTYALLEERVPPLPIPDREECLSELTHRYFASLGPASLHDFVWWSGLTMADARDGVAMLKPPFIQEQMEKHHYVYAPLSSTVKNIKDIHATFLLPDYDEYGISYKDRSSIFNIKRLSTTVIAGNPEFKHTLIIEGQAGGTWQRVVRNNKTTAETSFFVSMNKAKQAAVNAAIERYSASFTENVSAVIIHGIIYQISKCWNSTLIPFLLSAPTALC